MLSLGLGKTLAVPLSTQEYKWVPANFQKNLMKCYEGAHTSVTTKGAMPYKYNDQGSYIPGV